MRQAKATRLIPNVPTVAPYIKGTETPNYYLVLGETKKVIWGFRPLLVAVPALDSKPVDGEQTRIRVVPLESADVEKVGEALAILGFERRDYKDGKGIHFSTVVNNPATFVKKVEQLLKYEGCF